MTTEITVHPDLSVTIETATHLCELPVYHPETLAPWQSEQDARRFAERIAGDRRYMTLKSDLAPADPKEARLAEINARVATLISAGCPVDHEDATYHVSLEDGRRADLTAMGTTALGALSSAIAWPDSYQQGWITNENVRIPLPTPAAGLALGAAVGDHYAKIRQNGRDLKDAVLAAADAAALDAIDIEAGWP